MNFSNSQIAGMLKQVGAALTIKNANLFQIRAYENAASSVEHATSEIQDLWEEGQLDKVPGLGANLQEHLGELFKTGKVRHWEELKSSIPSGVFELLGITGVGPKTALKLAESGIKKREDLFHALKTGELVKKGFSKKLAEKIEMGLNEAEVSSGRMLLPYAFAQAERILEYVKKCPAVKEADSLGSLRRRVATIGDLDFSVASDNHTAVVKHLVGMPGISRVADQGESKVTLMLNSGLQLDFLIADADSYGALLQHFTGSKNHNIHLRTLAEKKGLSLSEYGVRKVKSQKVKGKSTDQNSKVIECKTEDELYGILGMQTPAPEIREDSGEVEAAVAGKLPRLVELGDIKADLHMHSSFPIEPSHDLGADTIQEMARICQSIGYQYIGISDHNPSVSGHSDKVYFSLVEKRSKVIEQINSSSKSIRVLNLLEVDIQVDGRLAIPDKAAEMLDYIVAGVHSSHRMPKDKMTKRILTALQHPKVGVLAHPTGRLLNERDAYDADWEEIFKFCARNNKALEINCFPNRLDLPDLLARSAKELGVKFTMGTDAHKEESLENMKFGVYVARRAWLETEDVLNSWDLKNFLNWFKINSR